MEILEKNKIKRGRGRPRGEPTFMKSFRVSKTMNEFFESIEAQNKFLVNLVANTREYKSFVKQKSELEAKNQPALFENA